MGKIYEDSVDPNSQTILGEHKVPPFSAIDFDGDDPIRLPKFSSELTEEHTNAINDTSDIIYHTPYPEFIEKMYGSAGVKKDEESYITDMLYTQLEPKFKHFRPPLSIKFFKWEISMMWAYKIAKAYLLKDCYPTGISSSLDNDTSSNGPIECIHIPQDQSPQNDNEDIGVDNRANFNLHAQTTAKELIEEIAEDDEEKMDELILEFQCAPTRSVAIDNIAKDLLEKVGKINNK